TVYLRLDAGNIADIAFIGQGCAILKASASLMTDAVKGKPKAEATRLFERFRKMVTGRPGDRFDASLGKLAVLSGVCEFPDGVPAWAAFLREVDFEGIVAAEGPPHSPETAKDGSGILPGLGALAESEAAYRSVRRDLESRGVRFSGLGSALASTPNLVKPHFGTAIPMDDHPFAALNGSLWTGGSFVYVPPDVHLEVPLQAEIRADYEKVEPFERNLIVADTGAQITYIEGCTAPVYTPDQLHVSAIEVLALPRSRVRYIALQNFS